MSGVVLPGFGEYTAGVSRQKLLQALFFLLLLFLPSQLGWHFWPNWAVVDGVRVDYLSPTIYFTDVLVLVALLWGTIVVYKLNLQKLFDDQKRGLFMSMFLFIAVNTLFSVSPAVTTFKWIRFWGVVFFGFLFAKNWFRYLSKQMVIVSLGIGVLISSILAIWQFLIQQSVGGWWYYLGERTFTQVTPGIANAFISGQLLLRPYGTFSHPNILGGFLGLALILIYAVFLREKRVNYQGFPYLKLYLSTVLVIGQTALFVTLSRAAIAAYLLSLLIFVWRRQFIKKRRIQVVMLLCLIGLVVLGQRLSNITVEIEPILVRWQNLIRTWEGIWVSPIFGTGLGTAPLVLKIEKISYSLRFQPPHSVILTFLLETGILGTLFVIATLYRIFIKSWDKFRDGDALSIATVSFILLTGMVDHYWLTINQSSLIMIVLGGMALSYSKS